MGMERSFEKQIASLEEVFAFLEQFFTQQKVLGRVRFALSVVVEELFTNLVKYNVMGRNPITIRLNRVEDDISLELVDRDVDAFDPSSLPPVDIDAPMAERQPGGLGLHLVRAIVDRISFDYHARVMTITVHKKLERDDV